MGDYYYLDLSLDFSSSAGCENINSFYLKERLVSSLKLVFGEVGASTCVDVLKYDEPSRRAIVRCSTAAYVKLHASLTLIGICQGFSCAFRVHQTSACLLSLLGSSRTHNHQLV